GSRYHLLYRNVGPRDRADGEPSVSASGGRSAFPGARAIAPPKNHRRNPPGPVRNVRGVKSGRGWPERLPAPTISRGLPATLRRATRRILPEWSVAGSERLLSARSRPPITALRRH